jgi:hypothetical protein
LLVQGLVIASGKPDDLAYGSNDAAREFIAASGIAPEKIRRVDRPAEGHTNEDEVIRYKPLS